MGIAIRTNTDSSFVIVSRNYSPGYHGGNTNAFVEFSNYRKNGTEIAPFPKIDFQMPDIDNYPAYSESGTGNLFVVNTPRNDQQVSHFFI